MAHLRVAPSDRNLVEHLEALAACRKCPSMTGPVVTGQPVRSEVLLIGQAPGSREGVLGRPFAWTAGKQMFRWFESIGLDEATFRGNVYMAAVCRCFPGKKTGGGDREPSPEEIAACATWLDAEIGLVRPKLILPVGRMAIAQILGPLPLDQAVGKMHHAQRAGHDFEVIPLPHPSGASTWFRREPGKSLLGDALRLLGAHAAWKHLVDTRESASGGKG